MQRTTVRPTTTLRYGRLGTTGMFAVAALLVIFVAGWLVDRRSASAADRALVTFARKSQEDPLRLLEAAARANRIVFLSDIHNSAAAKAFAAKAIERIARSSGLDAIIIETGQDQQPYIDQYLDRAPEDASVLLSHPRTIGNTGSATRAYLDLYHAVWSVNQSRGPDQRIRIIAADLADWPPNAPSPAEVARNLEKREANMERVIREQVLEPIPDARILVFMNGLHALKSGTIDIRTGGTAPVTVVPLAARLATSTSEVYSVLIDAPSSGISGRPLITYVGTRVADVLQEAGVNQRFGARVSDKFDYLRAPVRELKSPGIEYGVEPREYKLRQVADAYINLGN